MLENINSPEDLRKLDVAELKTLCSEVRTYMIECCSKNPGHLGSSLGAVELITGLHYVYDTPHDKIVFDVGHQAYAHKILTGRREAFADCRKKGGISGFTKMDESVYDAFGAGHSSTSISAALGLATAAQLNGDDTKVVALIGDGSLTGGLAYEGLNNAGTSKADILVIVNDNNISIDKNIGAMHEHLLKLTTSGAYNRLKNRVWNLIGEGRLREAIRSFIATTKHNIIRTSGGDIFEAMGFRYFGPIDGNDIEQVVATLQKLRGIKGPRVLHAITVKGKGYRPAEEQQTVWHAPGIFDPETGMRARKQGAADRYQDVFGEVLVELAKSDPKIVGITPAMASGCGMAEFAKEMPSRFFDVGIAEEHAVTFAAGLAAGGLKPFCNIYSSFSQRAYDQIIHDVALQRLPVVLCLDRAGLVGEDGATHNGVFDIAAYRSIPGAIIAVPADEMELKEMMYSAASAEKGPYIIRYPRGCGEGVRWRDVLPQGIEIGKGVRVREGSGVAVIAAGPAVWRCVRASERISAEHPDFRPAIYNMRYIKPIDEQILKEAAETGCIVTVEDGCIKGGLFGAVSEYVASHGLTTRVVAAGVPDRFIGNASQDEQRSECGIGTDELVHTIVSEFLRTSAKETKAAEK